MLSWFPCHHSTMYPYVVDGEDGLHIQKVAVCIWRDIAKNNLDLVRVQEVRWERYGTESVSMETGKENLELTTGLFVVIV
jgi:hypothetical protein